MGARDRAVEVLKRLPKGPVTGVEVGVFQGRMSAHLVRRPGLKLYMVDNWKPFARYSAEDQEYNYLRCLAVDGIVVRTESVIAASIFPDDSLDFVFIDADHGYAAVKADIGAWLPKVKKHGLLGGHDYDNPPYSGVKQAVDEFGFKLDLGENHTWFRA